MFRIALVLVLLVSALSAQTTLFDRARKPNDQIATIGPYNYIDTVNAVAASWACPDSVKVCWLRTLHPATVKVRLKRSKAVTIKLDSLEAWPIEIDTLYKTGTDSLMRTGNFIVIGFVR